MTREQYQAKIKAKNEAISEIYARMKNDERIKSAYDDDIGADNWAEKFKIEVSRVVMDVLSSDKYNGYVFNPSRLTEIAAENYDLDMSNNGQA